MSQQKLIRKLSLESTGRQDCRKRYWPRHRLMQAVLALLLLTATAWAADPGTPLPPASELNDQKLGSVLFFNLYNSSVGTPATQNTRFTLTNYNLSTPVQLRLLFVAAGGGVATADICLTQAQTASFLASDIDPGIRGFLIAVAIGSNGCPIQFNFLAGNAEIKLTSGHAASMAAVAVAAISATPTTCMMGSVSATLNFDGVSYNRLPRALSLAKVRSSSDGNSMILVLNRIGGNLQTNSPATLGSVTGELVDPVAQGFTFNTNSGSPQLFSTFTTVFPATTPPYTQLIPAGSTGWMSLASATDAGMLGAVLNFNPNAGSQASAFNGGGNLHMLTLATSTTLIIPANASGCP